jgi:hypothetical protein
MKTLTPTNVFFQRSKYQLQQRIWHPFYLISLCLFLSYSPKYFAQNIGISATGTPPQTSAGLDIDFTDKGLLVPRIELTSMISASPIISPALSLMVYNTATAGVAPNGVTPGFYFWDGTKWLRMIAQNTSSIDIDDLRVTIDHGSNPAQLGSFTGIPGPEIWFFRNNQGIEAMSFTVQMPHNWVEGSPIYPHIHWAPRLSGNGNVQWNLDYSWVDLNEITPATFTATTTSSIIVTGPFTMNSHILSNLTANNVGIDGTGKHISSVLICRIWRDSGVATDTFGGDCGGITIDFHHRVKNVFTD